MRLPRLIIFLTIFVLSSIYLQPSTIYAAVPSCTAVITPNSVDTNLSYQFRVILYSSTSVDFNWVKITRPSTNFTFVRASTTGWNSTINDSDITLTGGSLASGTGYQAYYITMEIGSSLAPAANWTVEVSDDPSGASPTTCTGSLSTAITGIGTPPVEPATISEVTVSSVSDTSVTITSTSDNNCTSNLTYGLDDNYGSEVSGSGVSTTHTFTLTGLTQNTTYHYLIDAVNDGGTTDTGDLTFTTAVTGTTSTVTVTTTVTNTVTNTQTVTQSTPSLVVMFNSSQNYKDPPAITGSVTDTGSNISSIEYSTSAGQSWSAVDKINSPNSKSTDFTFTPKLTQTGNYSLKVRARNATGNYGYTSIFTLRLDRTPPVIKVTTDFSRPYTKPPLISGSVADASGVASADYSLDSGKTWSPIDLDSKLKFSFSLPPLDDGTYTLKIKAADSVGNYSLSPVPYSLIIDRLPPSPGLPIYSLGPLLMQLDSSESLNLLPQLKTKITLSAIGGPTTMDLVIGSSHFPLSKDPYSNLWSGILSFSDPGLYSPVIYATDSAANSTTTIMNPLQVSVPGQITGPKEAKVSVYQLNSLNNRFILWNATEYSQTNPLTTVNHQYSLILPAGTYYLKITATDFVSQNSAIFTITKTTPITTDFSLIPQRYLNLLLFRIPLTWSDNPVPVHLNSDPSLNQNPASKLIGTPLPHFSLKTANQKYSDLDLHGKPALITFLNSYSPGTSEQLSFLNVINTNQFHFLVVLPQETVSTAEIFTKRGGYNLPIVADPDGLLIPSLHLSFSPTHIFINRKGQITNIKMGVLTPDVLLNNLIN